MRIGFLGGTFNPPHNGHIHLAREWSSRLALDRFLITPTGTPPHKAAADVPGEMRLEMCRIAAEESGGLLEAFDFEVRRSGQKSYSVITLSALHALYPDSEIFMVMGADMFVSLESWYDFDRLKTLATFCTMPRDGITPRQLEAGKHPVPQEMQTIQETAPAPGMRFQKQLFLKPRSPGMAPQITSW